MSHWYPVAEFGIIAIPVCFAGFMIIMKSSHVVAHTLGLLLGMIVAGVFVVPLARRYGVGVTNLQTTAIFIGAFVGIVLALVSRYWRRQEEKMEENVPHFMRPPVARLNRPWDGLPEEARRNLRAPGDLGDPSVYDETAQLQPLRLRSAPRLEV